MSGENSKRQTKVKRPRQKVGKRPVTEAAPAVRGPEETRRPGREGKTRKPAPAARNPERRKKQES